MKSLPGVNHVALLCIFLLAPGLLQAEPVDRLNVVLILADDLGYTDISPFGSEIKTPNIARLAHEGLSFINTPCLRENRQIDTYICRSLNWGFLLRQKWGVLLRH